MSFFAEFVAAVVVTTGLLLAIAVVGAVVRRVGELLDIKIGNEDDDR